MVCQHLTVLLHHLTAANYINAINIIRTPSCISKNIRECKAKDQSPLLRNLALIRQLNNVAHKNVCKGIYVPFNTTIHIATRGLYKPRRSCSVCLMKRRLCVERRHIETLFICFVEYFYTERTNVSRFGPPLNDRKVENILCIDS